MLGKEGEQRDSDSTAAPWKQKGHARAIENGLLAFKECKSKQVKLSLMRYFT